MVSAFGFAPVPMMRGARGATELSMALKDGEKVIVIGVAADSGAEKAHSCAVLRRFLGVLMWGLWVEDLKLALGRPIL